MEDKTITPHGMISILPQQYYAAARKFIDLGIELGCKTNIRYAKSNKYWRCVFSKKAPQRVLFTVECTHEWWRVKAMLSNLEQYKQELDNCPLTLVNAIKSAYDCRMCNSRCAGVKPFILDGIEYKKCMGCSYYFPSPDAGHSAALIILLKKKRSFKHMRFRISTCLIACF